MQSRGRRSAAKDTVVVAGSFGQRPDPPKQLNSRQAEIWREIVASEDGKFFDTGAKRGLLADYCRHRETSERLSDVINGFKTTCLADSEKLEQYRRLLKMREVESRLATLIATKLRMTNQARYTALSAATAARNVAKGAKPWEMK